MSHDALAGLLRSFHLPTMASIYADTLQQAEQSDWGYRKFLQHLCEIEAEDLRQRRIARLLKQSGLPDGKNLGNLDETLLSEKIRRQLPTLLEGGFVERGDVHRTKVLVMEIVVVLRNPEQIKLQGQVETLERSLD